jgi:ABC-type multidrug transport system permease subunit
MKTIRNILKNGLYAVGISSALLFSVSIGYNVYTLYGVPGFIIGTTLFFPIAIYHVILNFLVGNIGEVVLTSSWFFGTLVILGLADQLEKGERKNHL